MTKQAYYSILYASVVYFLLLVCKAALGGELKLLDLNTVNIEYKNFTPNTHSVYMTDGSILNKGLNLNINTDVLRFGYINQTVWSLTDQHQFRWVGWNYHIGLRVLSYLDVEWEHFSRHILDKEYPYKATQHQRFPVEDSINFRIYLFRRDKKEALSELFGL